jgi:transcription termination factor Rho
MSNTVSTAPELGSGFLEISEKGFGFLRSAENHFQPKPTDIFVTPDTIKKNFLREGCFVEGPTHTASRNESSVEGSPKVNEMPFPNTQKRCGSRI